MSRSQALNTSGRLIVMRPAAPLFSARIQSLSMMISSCENLVNGCDHIASLWEKGDFQRWSKRRRYEVSTNPHDRRVELVKALVDQGSRNFGANAKSRNRFVDNHRAMRTGYRLQHGGLVPRLDRAQVDDFGFDAFLRS